MVAKERPVHPLFRKSYRTDFGPQAMEIKATKILTTTTTT
jgi:hypothetical protein